jgi:hypothetical protein
MNLDKFLLAGRSVDTLIGKINAHQIIPGDRGGEAQWKDHLGSFIAAHEVMEVLSDDLDVKEAKNIQAMDIAGSGKGLIAFTKGLLAGAKSQLSEEDYNTLAKKLGGATALSLVIPPLILAGATVGIAKDIWAALKTVYEALTDWGKSILGEMIKNIVTMTNTLMFDEEGARILGEILGEEKGKEIKKLGGEDIFTFTYKLGEMIGPTVVYTILSITSAGAVAGALVSERLALFLKRFPKVAKGLERVRELMPKRRALKAAEEAEEVTKGTGKATAASGKVTPIEEANRIRARKAARAAEVAEPAEQALASGDRPRASSDAGGKGKGGKTVSGGSDELDAPKQVTESSGAGETNVPPERPPVEVESKVRGGAIERQHLDSMPEYNRPKAADFKGIDAWKGGKDAPPKILPNGQKVRTVTKADVLQVKSVGKASRIEAEVSEGLKGLDSDVFTSPTDKGLRVINPKSRTLDVIFEEGAVPDLNAEVRAIMRAQAEKAGKRLVEIRWYRFSGGKKTRITF